MLVDPDDQFHYPFIHPSVWCSSVGHSLDTSASYIANRLCLYNENYTATQLMKQNLDRNKVHCLEPSEMLQYSRFLNAQVK